MSRPLTAVTGVESDTAPSALRAVVSLVLRYAFNTMGPVSIAGAHFLSALIFLRFLPQAQFGLFSFAFIVVPFALSMTGALFGAAITNSANGAMPMTKTELATYIKASMVFALLAAAVIFLLMIAGTASPELAAILAVYGALMTIRWFGRCHAFAVHEMPRAITSDFIYSGVLVGGLVILILTGRLTATSAALTLAAGSACAILGFGRDFLWAQAGAWREGSLRAFIPIWRDLARWSLLGVVSTELTANAHAYLVTLISGPKSFALLAVGSLFMRPVSLVMTALPDAERAVMARAMAAGRFGQVVRAVFNFRVASFTVLAGALVLAAIIMIWFPEFILKRGYAESSVVAVLCIWVAINAVRAMRTPESVMLQAAGEFRPLAGASVRSSIVSLAATSVLLFVFGPIVSLGGVLIGDLVMSGRIFALGRKWRAGHV